MAKRKKKEEDGMPPLPGWMATYSDMVTLLLTFFVMLLAMANFEDIKRMEDVMESVRKSLGVHGWAKQQLKTQVGKAMSEELRKQTTVQPIVARLREAMQKHVSDQMVRITQNQREIRLRLDSRVFFKPATAELHPAALGLLADIARVVAEERSLSVKVEGHTDNVGSEARNWRLSAERAVTVVEVLRDKGPIEGGRLQATGMGSFRPSSEYSGDSPWNRRVEIVLMADHISASGATKMMTTLGDSDG